MNVFIEYRDSGRVFWIAETQQGIGARFDNNDPFHLNDIDSELENSLRELLQHCNSECFDPEINIPKRIAEEISELFKKLLPFFDKGLSNKASFKVPDALRKELNLIEETIPVEEWINMYGG